MANAYVRNFMIDKLSTLKTDHEIIDFGVEFGGGVSKVQISDLVKSITRHDCLL